MKKYNEDVNIIDTNSITVHRIVCYVKRKHTKISKNYNMLAFNARIEHCSNLKMIEDPKYRTRYNLDNINNPDVARSIFILDDI